MFVFFSRTTGHISTKRGARYSWVKGIQAYSIEGTRPYPRGDNNKIAKIHSKIFFSKNNELISTKLGAKHPWVKGIQVCSNEGSRHFPRLDDNKTAKIHVHWRNLKFLFSRTTKPFSTKLCTRHFLGKDNSSLFKWRAPSFSN